MSNLLAPEILKTIKMTDFTAIVTINADGSPHVVAAWNCLPTGGNQLLVSGERYVQTRENLKRDQRVWLLVASRQLDTGYRITGKGGLSNDPAEVELIRKYWPRCTFALKIEIEKIEDLAHWKAPTP